MIDSMELLIVIFKQTNTITNLILVNCFTIINYTKYLFP